MASVKVAARSDFARLRLVVPIRLAAAMTLVLSIGVVLDQIALGVAAAIGAFMVGIADMGDCFPVRARVMGIATIAVAFITVVGGLVSENVILTIALSPFVAFACGYATTFGPNASLTGTLVLVVYSLYAGSPVGENDVLIQAAAVILGGAVQAVFALAGWPLRRVSGMRSQLADTWRMFYISGRGEPAGLLSPEIPSQIVHCAAETRWSGTKGATLAWLQQVLDAAEQLRLPLASIASRRATLVELGKRGDELRDLEELSAQVAYFSRSVSRALVLPMRHRAVAKAMSRVADSAAVARQWAPVQVDAIVEACQLAADQLAGQLPIGRRAELTFALNMGSTNWRRALGSQWSWTSPIMRHSIRLAAVTPVAWIVGELVLTEHKYWVALTVAWVARPGYGITVGRVIARTVGTLIGLVVITGVILAADPNVWGLVAICAVSGYLMYASLPVNYAVAVVFITTLIVTLLGMSGDSLEGSISNRAVGTVLGGVLTLIASQFGASWAAPTLAQKLLAVTAGTKEYVHAVFHHDQDVRLAAGNLVNARQDAASAIQEAELEPQRGHLPPARAERVLSALLASIFLVASVDASKTAGVPIDSIDPDQLDEALTELEQHLEAIHEGREVVSPGPMPQVPVVDPAAGDAVDPACQAVRRAIAYL